MALTQRVPLEEGGQVKYGLLSGILEVEEVVEAVEEAVVVVEEAYRSPLSLNNS